MRKVVSAGIFMLAGALLHVACENSKGAKAANGQKPEDLAETLAKVDDVTITVGEFQEHPEGAVAADDVARARRRAAGRVVRRAQERDPRVIAQGHRPGDVGADEVSLDQVPADTGEDDARAVRPGHLDPGPDQV